ncbi:hypothetical protein TNCT_564951 [Trichonephila clavata]|uniref:Uncharacterized protein n=1 Tax=Trichonephila clavata TaxID=2740835 RepID=A0A8X6GW61_TRICU|nr:hypothetical protein TNCT_564951 [Trichonephila clavata]
MTRGMVSISQRSNQFLILPEKFCNLLFHGSSRLKRKESWFFLPRPGHVVRYCRERKAIFDSDRNRRQSFDEIEVEEGALRPNFLPRSTPSPARGRSSQHAVSNRRRLIVAPVDLQAIGMRKAKRSDLPRR